MYLLIAKQNCTFYEACKIEDFSEFSLHAMTLSPPQEEPDTETKNKEKCYFQNRGCLLIIHNIGAVNVFTI